MANEEMPSMNRKNCLALSLGVILGVIATSAYWHSSQERKKFMFENNIKCQQMAKRYETENNLPTRLVIVLKAAYSPARNSCVAEVTKVQEGNIDYIVEDLISGDFLFYGRHNSGQNDIDPKKMTMDQDAKFASFAR